MDMRTIPIRPEKEQSNKKDRTGQSKFSSVYIFQRYKYMQKNKKKYQLHVIITLGPKDSLNIGSYDI